MSAGIPYKSQLSGRQDLPVPPRPAEIRNPPGLSAIAYRMGTYSSFCQAMLEAAAEKPELRGWNARAGDYGTALFAMWAYLGDILTFYQERAANEAFILTALHRESVLRLAAMLGYKRAPGVAATVHLAFSVQENEQVCIPRGTQVQSVPGADGEPQIFELEELIVADVQLSSLRAYPPAEPHNPLSPASIGGDLKPDIEENPALAPGDQLVVFSRAKPDDSSDKADSGPMVSGGVVEEKVLVEIETSDLLARGITTLRWAPPVASDQLSPENARMHKWLRKFRLFGHAAPESYFRAEPSSEGVDMQWRKIEAGSDTYNFELPAGQQLVLDGYYEELKPGAQVLISTPGFIQRTNVVAVDQVFETKGPLESTVTSLTLESEVPEVDDLRRVVVYELEPIEIPLWDEKVPEQLSGHTVYVAQGDLAEIEPGRTIILDDEKAEPHVATALGTTADGGYLELTFSPALTRELDGSNTVLYGNVARATHGETVIGEVLGSGDSAAKFQTFSVKESPVTFVPRPGASHGMNNTLEVRVDEVLWHEVQDFFGCNSTERIYATAEDERGVMGVRFGDGKTGARLPNGTDNVTASYRRGVGRSGNVRARSLTTPLDRPLGLKRVTNPGPAQGGADPETKDEMRIHAPRSVRVLERVVSLRDYRDAALRFPGVVKARAVRTYIQGQQTVRLTVAGGEGKQVSDETLRNLAGHLHHVRDAGCELLVKSYEGLPVEVGVTIRPHPDHLAGDVQAEVEQVLYDAFAFDNRDLGEPVYLSPLYQALQQVDGVVAVRVTHLRFRETEEVCHAATPEVRDTLPVGPGQLAILEKAEDVSVVVDMEDWT